MSRKYKLLYVTLAVILLVILLNRKIITLEKTHASDNNILKINELYKTREVVNNQKEQLEIKKQELSKVVEKVEKGICTREDIIFGTELSIEEIMENYELEVSILNKEITDKDKEIKDIDKLVKVYDKLVNSETKTLLTAINEYSKVNIEIISKTDTGNGNNFINPVVGSSLTSKYGHRVHPIFKKTMYHSGVDLANKEGTNIKASERGLVIHTSYNSGTGNVMVLAHNNGYFTVYAHIKNNGFIAKKGDTVEKGQTIALMGSTGWSTGPHVHFEIFKGNNRQDPLKFIKIK